MNYLNKAVNIFWLMLASILLAMSISGIIFMAYHVFIQGVTINFGIY